MSATKADLPLVITDESLLPDECCRMEGWISTSAWRGVEAIADGIGVPMPPHGLKRVPDPAAIRAKLLEPCPRCKGAGDLCPSGPSDAPMNVCPVCDGSGKAAVPGCHLAERGAHLECR